MYDVDVNGTHATLWAASEAGTEQVLVTSSATAYGALPDNPKPIAEDWPVRGAPDFSYARDKAEADRVCQLWAARAPRPRDDVVRPCIVFGPERRQLHRPGLDRTTRSCRCSTAHDEEFQLVHEDDVVSALFALLDGKEAGAFNLAGDGTMTWRQSAELIGQKTREISLKNMKRFNGAMWRLHVPNTDAPARQPRLPPLPLGRLDREAEGRDRLAAEVRHARDLQGDDARQGQAAGRAERRRRPSTPVALTTPRPLVPFDTPGV